jgi:L-rhamnonate dehydratase
MMRVTAVEPILIRGREAYRSTSGGEEATDNGDQQLLVRVATSEGLEGWADIETLPGPAAQVIAGQSMGITGFKTLADLVIGENPFDTQRIWDKLYVGSAYFGRRGVVMQCISAIDNALWSIKAQAAGVSLATLLGGARRDQVKAYASTLFRDTPEGMARACQDYVAKGFKAVKFGWGVFGEDTGRDRELVAAAREALGPDRHLLVDPGWYAVGWKNPDAAPIGALRSRREAIALTEWLGTYGVGWCEDFIHPDRFDEYAAVRAESPVRIAAGEQVATIWDFERFIRMGCVDVVQPDLSRCGGLTVALQVRDLATEAGIDLVPHSWLTHLLTASSLALIATLPRALFVEFNVAQSLLTKGVTAGRPFTLDADGYVAVPTGVGLGVEIDRDFIAAHRADR